MSDHLPLNAMADRAAAEVGAPGLRPVLLKELLHYDILLCLDQSGFLATLTFHGGTALRLCYGAPRFSEDLDFAAGPDFQRGITVMVLSRAARTYGSMP